MVDDCTVFYHGPERVMVMGANPRLGEDLRIHAGPGVQVRECRAEFAQIAVQGPKSRAVLQQLTGADLSNESLPYYTFRTGVDIAGISMQISRLGFTGELGYELLLPVDQTPKLWQALRKAGASHGLRAVGGAGLMMARIEAGLIMGGLDYDDSSTPWECRMGWAVDLKKPDFQGKSALVALKPMAKVTVVGIVFPEGAEGLDGAEVTDQGKVIGAISMAVPSPALGGRMLAMARIDLTQATAGRAVQAAGTIGEIVDLPIHDPERKKAKG